MLYLEIKIPKLKNIRARIWEFGTTREGGCVKYRGKGKRTKIKTHSTMENVWPPQNDIQGFDRVIYF